MLQTGALLLLCATWTTIVRAQLEEDFTPHPANWILASGFSYHTINGNDVVLSSNGSSGNGTIGTPIVMKSANTSTVNFCASIFGYTPQDALTSLPCAATYDLYFTNTNVNNSNDLDETDPTKVYGTVKGLVVPASGGKVCNSFTFPASVTVTQFRVFLVINPGCNMGNVRFAFDDFVITGLTEVCTGAACPPVALPDVFFTGPVLSANVVLYGPNAAYPAPPAGYQASANGLDNDPNDPYSALTWTLQTPPDPATGSVTMNPGGQGTATVTRANTSVTLVNFIYQLCDPNGNCDTAAVSVTFPAGGALPISLLNFKGNRNGGNVTLKWITTNENNNAGFEIQRIVNGEYKKVGYVASKSGSGDFQVTYQFDEINFVNAVSWYRLVQINQDGSRQIMPSLAIRGLDELKKMLIYPNPGIAINVLFASTSVRDVAIIDVSGKLLKRWNNYSDDNITISGLQPGMYMLRVIDRKTKLQTVSKIQITK
ncbi:hypothetical protein A4D02_13555 [Niastella koreensis]|nr:hypothetical protein A4D02_13555 [Niastella koreensis]